LCRYGWPRGTTSGDLLFLVLRFLLIIAVAVSLFLWIIALLIGRKAKVCRFLGYTTLVFVGALGLSILTGQLYYHYFGYGAYKKAFQKWHYTYSLLRQMNVSCESYAVSSGQYPTNKEQVIMAIKENGGFIPGDKHQDGVIRDSWGTPIELMFNEDKIVARSAGPDCKFNTKDDLTNIDY
jgi:hypothetical protein